MKNIIRTALFALSLLSFTTPNLTSAQTAGSAADGSVKISVEDETTKVIEFKAVNNRDGSTDGSMIFSGPVTIPNQDVDGDGNKDFSGRLASLDFDAQFDSLVTDKNRAVMSGTITNCNVREYIGRRVLLTVEDNGDGTNPKLLDKITWGIYTTREINWTPTDSEWKEDPGVGLRWWATDYEVKGDIGYAMPRQEQPASTQTFPTISYSFIDVQTGNGDIHVQP
ncbi:MAG TPA: hypothetical protein VJT82_06975 [Pyrinomonadaceae bacterium]|nr:hypothetical protein [Pyrinomonadaceae bacterium]